MRQLQVLKETVTAASLSRMATAVAHWGAGQQSGNKLEPQVSRGVAEARRDADMYCAASPREFAFEMKPENCNFAALCGASRLHLKQRCICRRIWLKVC